MVSLTYIMLTIKWLHLYIGFVKVGGESMEKRKRARRSAPGDISYKTRTIRLRVSEEEYLHFMELADKRGMTLSELIRTGVRLLEIY